MIGWISTRVAMTNGLARKGFELNLYWHWWGPPGISKLLIELEPSLVLNKSTKSCQTQRKAKTLKAINNWHCIRMAKQDNLLQCSKAVSKKAMILTPKVGTWPAHSLAQKALDNLHLIEIKWYKLSPSWFSLFSCAIKMFNLTCTLSHFFIVFLDNGINVCNQFGIFALF